MHKHPHLTLALAALLAAAPFTPAPAAAPPQSDEPIAVPRSVKQGIDFVYVDPQMSTVAKRHQRPRNWLDRIFSGSGKTTPNPLFLSLADGLQRYRATWGALPQTKILAGPVLKPGSTGKRVALLRTRLGLSKGSTYDNQLAAQLADYQRVHGIGPADGTLGRSTLASLNRGAVYYERRIAINMERAYRLPMTGVFDRYVLVDSGSAMASLYQRDRVADTMRVVVGSPKTKTPIMAVLMRAAKANPYWNVPPELIRSLTAQRVLEQGPAYIANFHYEILSDWGPTARPLTPTQINWKQVAAGRSDIRVRQLPGPWNSMGAMKFEMPNQYGIYLHDTPHKELFAQDDRWLSNGCVRLSDYRRFASWVFDRPPAPTAEPDKIFTLAKPVPVYLTYLTVAATPGGVTFRPDPYGLDSLAMPQMFGT